MSCASSDTVTISYDRQVVPLTLIGDYYHIAISLMYPIICTFVLDLYRFIDKV
jgi:hypothetical protein